MARLRGPDACEFVGVVDVGVLEHPGIVDDDIDAAAGRRQRFGPQPVGDPRLGEIGGEEAVAAAGALPDDMVPGGGERGEGGGADAARGAGEKDVGHAAPVARLLRRCNHAHGICRRLSGGRVLTFGLLNLRSFCRTQGVGNRWDTHFGLATARACCSPHRTAALAQRADDKFFLKGGAFISDINGSFRIDGNNGTIGSNVSLEKDLGLSGTSVGPYALAGWRFSKHWRFEFEYFTLSREGTKTIDRTDHRRGHGLSGQCRYQRRHFHRYLPFLDRLVVPARRRLRAGCQPWYLSQ